MIGTSELLIIALVVFLLFGGEKLPKLAKSLGEFVSEFNKSKDGLLSPSKTTKPKRKKKKVTDVSSK